MTLWLIVPALVLLKSALFSLCLEPPFFLNLVLFVGNFELYNGPSILVVLKGCLLFLSVRRL